MKAVIDQAAVQQRMDDCLALFLEACRRYKAAQDAKPPGEPRLLGAQIVKLAIRTLIENGYEPDIINRALLPLATMRRLLKRIGRWLCRHGHHSYGEWFKFQTPYCDGVERECSRCWHRQSRTVWDGWNP
jgi:hypothetical protein